MKNDSRICVSIGNCTVAECLAALEGQEFAEVRLDSISGVSEKAVEKIFSQKARQIATCRANGKVDDAARKKLLLAAIDAGAAFADVEVDANDAFKQEIVRKAKEKGCRVIVSFHDFEKTPQRAELDQIVNWCFESGADIAKIACKAKSERDNARLLGLLDSGKKLVVIGMGEIGRVTRICAPLLGSQFTFASVGSGKETAEGQMDADSLKKAFEALKDV